MKQSESAILVISDLHYGKKTESFDTDVFKRRMNKLGKKLDAIRGLLSDYDFEELVICILGDANDGTEIFPGQPNYQDVTDARQQAKELAEFLAHWVVERKKVWERVRVEAVPGNHGRSGRFAHEAANWDLVAYEFLKHRLEGEGVSVNFNEQGERFLRKIKVRKHSYLLYHAHEIRMYQNIPWYGIATRLMRWYSSHLGPFDVAFLGHFHTFGDWTINKIHMLSTGTTVTNDDWAFRTLGMESANKWWLLGCSDKHPITWQFGLDIA